MEERIIIEQGDDPEGADDIRAILVRIDGEDYLFRDEEWENC